MPLGVLSEEDFDKELNSSKSSSVSNPVRDDSNANIEQPANSGRGSVSNIPQSIRAFVAGESLNGARAQDISRDFKVSESSISAYKKGATSTATYREPNKDLAPKVDAIRGKIVNTAQKRLRAALRALTPEKLMEADARGLSGIAKDMATIIDKVQPKVVDDTQRVHLHLIVPPQKHIETYEVIDVKE